MKTQIRTLFLSAAIACFFALTFVAFAQEKPAAAPEPQPAENAPPPAEPTAATTPAAPDDPSTVQPAKAAEPDEKAESDDKAEPALRHLDAPAPAVSAEKSAGDETVSSSSADSDQEQSKPTAPKKKAKTRPTHSHGNGNDKVGIFRSAYLAKGEKADTVVSVLGSATSEGEVTDSVVSVLGHNRVTGPVGDTVVSVLGNSYINSKVNGQVVTVLGNLELGPDAEVGDIVVIGRLKKDPKAIVHGEIENTEMDTQFSELTGLHTWIERCFLYGRPLAVGPHLGWAWALAVAFLAFYIFVALLFSRAIERCIQTLEMRPGYSILATVLTVLLLPIVGILLIVLLAITGVGLVVIPFLFAAVFFATLFGKAVMLAWLGSRITRFFGDGPLRHVAMAVLVGGLIMLALYTVPVVGLVVYKLLDLLGLGVVVYTLVLAMRREKPKAPLAAAAVPVTSASVNAGVVPPTPVTPMPAATVSEATVNAAPAPMDAASPIMAEPPVVSAPPVQTAIPVSPVPPIVPPIMAVSAATLPRAGFWIRFAASFLDWVIVGTSCGILHGGSSVPFVFAAYCVAFWATKGTTVGGIVCGLKVVRLDDRPVDWTVALVRALGGFLSVAVAGLGFIWVAFDADKQSWHDKIAGTTIVRMPKGVAII